MSNYWLIIYIMWTYLYYLKKYIVLQYKYSIYILVQKSDGNIV